MQKKPKSTPKKAKPKKSRARKSDSIRKRKVAVKPTAADSFLGRIKTAFDDTAGKIKMFLPAERSGKEIDQPKSAAE
jgi:hypothetical protein